MTHIVFYEKPGCANNTRQKAWLAAAGHTIEARNLLTHTWTCDELLCFFGDRPVADWFNRAAPRVKSGEIRPEVLDVAAAIDLLLQDPLLIRRPLIEADGRREVGFEMARIRAWLGLPDAVVRATTASDARALESCINPTHRCPPPAAESLPGSSLP